MNNSGCEDKSVSKIVARGAEGLGVILPPGIAKSFEMYYTLLERNAKVFNLTAITGAEEVARLHFLDSLALMGVMSYKNARVIDIGSGAGFPGLPLKLADPSIELTLLDASAKRVEFLTELCLTLGVDAACVHARAEEFARIPEGREQFEIALSRAVSKLSVLCELCLPLLKVGGVFLAMKSDKSAEELENSHNAINILGAELKGTVNYTIPETEITRSVIIISKTSQTPKEFPRRFAKIKKTPIISSFRNNSV